MTIQITQPEVEALIHQRLQTGEYRDAEEVVLEALRSTSIVKPSQGDPAPSVRSLREVFEAVRGLADDLDFSRNPSMGRKVDLT